MGTRGTICLMYHEIELPGRELCDPDPGYSRYAVSLDNFRRQMRFLKEAGMPGINVTQMLSNPGTGVGLTFDDGCETDLITAAPILKELRFQATFYITVNFLERRGFMSRKQARELAEGGAEVGCHSLTHPYLTDLDAAGLELEIAGAKRQLEDIVGKPVKHFSCPGGRWDGRVVEVAKRAGYKSVATSRIGMHTSGADQYSLPRIAVTRDVSIEGFSNICAGTGLWGKQVKGRTLQLAKQLMGNTAYNRLRSVVLKEQND